VPGRTIAHVAPRTVIIAKGIVGVVFGALVGLVAGAYYWIGPIGDAIDGGGDPHVLAVVAFSVVTVGGLGAGMASGFGLAVLMRRSEPSR
jgi:hypothetical protein